MSDSWSFAVLSAVASSAIPVALFVARLEVVAVRTIVFVATALVAPRDLAVAAPLIVAFASLFRV